MYQKYIKRVLDIFLSILLMPIICVIIGIFFILIKTEDKGPVFYTGRRLGKNGETFRMYKIRTMKVNAEDIRNADGSTFNSSNDLRVTKIGKILRKTSMDEIPQIFNVFLGNMSFVGPRPDLPEHIDCYSEEEKKKLLVTPGITGFNQAYYRNLLKWKDRLKNDVYYVDNISFILDVKILIKTIGVVLIRKGVYIQETTVTKAEVAATNQKECDVDNTAIEN